VGHGCYVRAMLLLRFLFLFILIRININFFIFVIITTTTQSYELLLIIYFVHVFYFVCIPHPHPHPRAHTYAHALSDGDFDPSLDDPADPPAPVPRHARASMAATTDPVTNKRFSSADNSRPASARGGAEASVKAKAANHTGVAGSGSKPGAQIQKNAKTAKKQGVFA
jgi:hypothetical protein